MFEVFEDLLEKTFQVIHIVNWMLENEELLLRSFDRIDAILTSYEWEKENSKKQAKRSHKKRSDFEKEARLFFVGNIARIFYTFSRLF